MVEMAAEEDMLLSEQIHSFGHYIHLNLTNIFQQNTEAMALKAEAPEHKEKI